MVMNLVWQRTIFGKVEKTAIIFAFWRRLQLPFSIVTNTTHGGHFSPSRSSSSSASTVPYPSSEMVDYLRMSCAFPSEAAVGVCKKLGNRGCVKKAEMIVGFLRESGFTDTHIGKAIIRRPMLLEADLEKTLRPMVRAFLDWGLSGPDVAYLVASNPDIVGTNFEKTVIPVVDLLETLLADHNKVISSIKFLFSRHCLVHDGDKRMAINLSSLRSLGVPDRSSLMLLLKRPTLFSVKPSTLEKMAKKARGLGFNYGSPTFPYALFAFSRMSESVWDAKLEVLKGFGCTQEDIMVAFHKAPLFLTLSASNLKKKLQFLVEGLGLMPSEMRAHPDVLMYSMEKRMEPRLTVVRILDSKKLLERNRSFLTILRMKEKAFYDEYVLKYKDECPDILEVYSRIIKGDADA